MNPGTSFGLWLKARRRSMDLTQPDLAKRVGCSLETIVKIESGERRPGVRLLTLTGPTGVGKTRLAVEVATELLNDFDSGVYFVALASISDHRLVAPTIAQALGVREAGRKPLLDSLKNFLRDKRTLLVLDNFEQVAQAAPLVGDLLASAPRLKVLITSRAVLHVYGEYEL